MTASSHDSALYWQHCLPSNGYPHCVLMICVCCALQPQHPKSNPCDGRLPTQDPNGPCLLASERLLCVSDFARLTRQQILKNFNTLVSTTRTRSAVNESRNRDKTLLIRRRESKELMVTQSETAHKFRSSTVLLSPPAFKVLVTGADEMHT